MPDPTHVHLAISHVPVMGVIFGILLLVWGFARRSAEVKRASLALFILSALGAAVTFATGEPAEERAESFAGVSGRAIERHEDAAKLAAAVTYALGVASLLGLGLLWKFPGRAASVVMPVVLAIALVNGALLARVANLGGAIRHPEVSASADVAQADRADHDRHDQDD
jgi:uncharacterized membrane protein